MGNLLALRQPTILICTRGNVQGLGVASKVVLFYGYFVAFISTPHVGRSKYKQCEKDITIANLGHMLTRYDVIETVSKSDTYSLYFMQLMLILFFYKELEILSFLA